MVQNKYKVGDYCLVDFTGTYMQDLRCNFMYKIIKIVDFRVEFEIITPDVDTYGSQNTFEIPSDFDRWSKVLGSNEIAIKVLYGK